MNEEKLDKAEKVMDLVSNKGLSLVLAVVFSAYLLWNNYILVERLGTYATNLTEFNNTLKAIDRRLELLEDKLHGIDK